jgi:hypothetical protein
MSPRADKPRNSARLALAAIRATIALDPRGNVKADTESYQTSARKVFTAGDTEHVLPK